MSIDSTSSAISRKKALTGTLSQSDHYPYARHSLKDRPPRSHSSTRTMSVSEETPGDILTDLTKSYPYTPSQHINNKRNRRFSELKPSLFHDSNSDRRNSISQISLSSLLPNPFRSNKYHQKNTTKDEANTSFHILDDNSSLYHNNTMTTKTEPVSSLKLSNATTNGSRTNLSLIHDRSFSMNQEDSTSLSSTSSSFVLDISLTEPRSAETLILKLHTPLCVAEIYREHFYDYFHINYCGELEQECPFIASLRYFYTKSTLTDNTSDTNCQARAIIRVPSRNYDVSTTINGTNDDNILQTLFTKANLPVIHTCKNIGDPKANEKIYLFDKLNDERQNCKVGLIYQRLDQTNEYDIFSNDNLSDDLLTFLQILSERVRLKGFNRYRGDLDVKDDLHGEYSYYTQYQNHEIMFNIAPVIPSTKANGQCIERKGLVGNSFVCIVFQEGDTEFLPDFISGKVTQVYIIVQPIRIEEQLYYKIGIWHRNDVTSIIDPPGGIYLSDQSFRDYFITVLLNSINVAIESPKLRFRITEQRQRLKQDELRKLSQNLSIGQILETVPDNESVKENRSYSRTENPPSMDNINPNPGRISPAATTKKRTFSKIFNVFAITKSNSNSSPSPNLSISIPPNIHELSSGNPPSPDSSLTKTRTLPSTTKEPVKRAASVKFRPAPPPPVPARMPVSQTLSVASNQSLSSSTHSSISNDTNLSNSIILEEPGRSRSLSSPDDRANTTMKLQTLTGSRISEENDDTSSSVDDESIEDDNIEHRQTVTEPPLSIPSNTNS